MSEAANLRYSQGGGYEGRMTSPDIDNATTRSNKSTNNATCQRRGKKRCRCLCNRRLQNSISQVATRACETKAKDLDKDFAKLAEMYMSRSAGRRRRWCSFKFAVT